MQHRCFAASGLLPLVLIEMLIVAAALLAIGSSLKATIRGIVLSATVQADPLRGRRPSVPSSAHGSQQATSMGWRQVRPSNVWTLVQMTPATYRVEYNAVPCGRAIDSTRKSIISNSYWIADVLCISHTLSVLLSSNDMRRYPHKRGAMSPQLRRAWAFSSHAVMARS